jgi:hypothetical protein
MRRQKNKKKKPKMKGIPKEIALMVRTTTAMV